MRRDFPERPHLVVWELTRACAPCRSEAASRRDPDELTTEEGHRLLMRLTGFGEPLPRLVFTGGDLLCRSDCAALTAAAAKLGFRVAVTPRATAAATREQIRALKEAGLTRLVVGLDGPTPDVHDGFREVRGSFDRTLKILEAARALGLPGQIHSRVTRQTLAGLPALARLIGELRAVSWSVAFPVPNGRGEPGGSITPYECESLLNDLHDLSLAMPFRIQTEEAPHYRRVILERRRGIRRDGRPVGPVPSPAPARRDPLRWAPIRDGKGLLFIDHRGEVYPGAFLPLASGNVRWASPVTIYRTHPLFRSLRDPDRLKGRCGRCPFRDLCGGSRARAFAVTGDPLGEEPLCLYTPCADPMEG